MAETSPTDKISLQGDKKESAQSAPLLSPDSLEGIAELRNYVAASLSLNHDLNNPLAGIMGFLELAFSHKDKMDPSVCELLELVEKSAIKLKNRIDEFAEVKHSMQRKVDTSSLEKSGADG